MTPVDQDSIDYIKESNNILAQKGKTFFWAKFLLKQEHAEDATRLYRFCRYIDDIGDESDDKTHAHTTLSKVISEILQGKSNDPVIDDAISLFNKKNIDVKIAIELINGVISDLKSVRIESEDQLLIYCYQVAGTVGLMMSKILDVQDGRAYAHAIDLGIAMQLTNICRDVTEDALMHRRYIPGSMCKNLEPNLFINPDKDTKNLISKNLTYLLNMADTYYKSGHDGLCFLPLRARMGMAIAAFLYRHIGVKLKNNHYEFWNGRIFVSNSLKLGLTIQILLSSFSNTGFYRYKGQHQAQLHQLLKNLPHVHESTF
jgi:15-cis-phytoene synthase